MPNQRNFKKIVRTFAAKHDLSYTDALALLLASRESFGSLSSGVVLDEVDSLLPAQIYHTQLRQWNTFDLGKDNIQTPTMWSCLDNPNLHIFGNTGSGKTSIVKNIISQASESNHWKTIIASNSGEFDYLKNSERANLVQEFSLEILTIYFRLCKTRLLNLKNQLLLIAPPSLLWTRTRLLVT